MPIMARTISKKPKEYDTVTVLSNNPVIKKETGIRVVKVTTPARIFKAKKMKKFQIQKTFQSFSLPDQFLLISSIIIYYQLTI